MTCGNGTQVRYRACNNPPPTHGGRNCLGPRISTQGCYVKSCFGMFSDISLTISQENIVLLPLLPLLVNQTWWLDFK